MYDSYTNHTFKSKIKNTLVQLSGLVSSIRWGPVTKKVHIQKKDSSFEKIRFDEDIGVLVED